MFIVGTIRIILTPTVATYTSLNGACS